MLQGSEREQVCVNDPQAPVQKTQDGKRPGYNGQMAVDAELGYVVVEEVTTAQNDSEQFVPLADQAVANLGKTPERLVADGGYQSGEALADVAAREWNAYIKQPPTDGKGLFSHDDFTYDETSDTFTCPAGQPLVFRGLRYLREKPYRRYRAAPVPVTRPGRCAQRVHFGGAGGESGQAGGLGAGRWVVGPVGRRGRLVGGSFGLAWGPRGASNGPGRPEDVPGE